MISPFDFVLVVFAAGAIIDVWHKGSIFETPRAYLQAIQDITPRETLKGRLLELVGCPFCKSYHIPFYLLGALLLADWVGGMLPTILRWVLASWAATRIGNIVDGFLPPNKRYIPEDEN